MAVPIGFNDTLTSFVEGGGGLTFYRWEPTDGPERDAIALMNVAGYLANTEVPLMEALAIAEEDTRERFRQENDPDGDGWEDLDPDYLIYKLEQGYPETILERTDLLSRQAPLGWMIVGDMLVYDTHVLPDYGMIHQEGTAAPGKVRAAFEARQRGDVARSTGEPGYRHVGMGIGRGRGTPQRAFIGLSEEAAFEILAAFDRWFEAIVPIWEDPIPPPMEHFKIRGREFYPVRIPKGQPGGGRFTFGSHFA